MDEIHKEVIVERGEGGSGTGVIAGILIAILLVALVYLAYDRGMFGAREGVKDDPDAVIQINTGDSSDTN